MSARFVLDTAEMEEKFFADKSLIGIVSTLPAYRFCWMLNERLGTRFVRMPEQDLVLQSKEKGKQQLHYFPLYQYAIPSNGSIFSIYTLKTGNEVLLPEIKQLDYLWMIESSFAETEADEIAIYLRNLQDIQLAQILSADRLKHINHLLV